MSDSTNHRRCTIEEYQQFLTSVPDAALLINEQGVIVFANEETLQLLGFTAAELMGAPLDQIIPLRLSEAHEQYRQKYMSQPWRRPMADSRDLSIRHKNGQEIPVIISIAPLRLEQTTLVAAFVRDISERKAMERILQKAHDELELQVVERTSQLQESNAALRAEIAERLRVEEELRQLTGHLAQREEHLVQELRALLKLSTTTPSPITAQAFGLLPLSESLVETFQELVHQYGDLLDLALEEKAFKVDHHLAESLRTLAARLGFLNAGPQDIVLLHSQALKQKSATTSYFKTRAYFDEGRLMVLQLMGYLVAYYRSYSLHPVRTDHTSSPANVPARDDHMTYTARED